MTFQQFTEKIGKNKLSQKKEKKMLSQLIRQRFDNPHTNQTELQNLILLAKILKLKCFDQMMQDYDHSEYYLTLK